jgi:AcrR family transcriptional regulator
VTVASPGPPRLLEGEDLPPEPRQRRSREKRVRLTAAGLELFGERGYETTSVEEIARRAGLAVGGFYLHFRSKRQLLLALMDELLRSLAALDLRPRGGSGVRDGLRRLLAGALAADLRYLGAYRAWREAALADAELERLQEQIHAWTRRRVEVALERLESLPGARRGVDVPGLARVLDELFWGLLAQARRLPAPELERWVEAATHLVYHAMFTDPPGGRSS